ncbi:TPA: hypothetical protein JS274_004599 [Escherichia coli]|nr:hypothetical protein [Escherichia coli]
MMHELEVLLSRLKMEHLSYHLESLLEQAAKKELNFSLPSDPASRRRPCASLVLRHHQAGQGLSSPSC